MIARFLSLTALAFALTGCGLLPFSRSAAPETAAQSQRLVRIDWFGHQCFRIRSTLGLSVLTNPFAPGTTGFSQPKGLTPEVVLSTSESADTNYVDMVDNTPHLLRASVGIGTNNASGIRIVGVPILRDPEAQDFSGMNVIYNWTMDGLRFCFLGKLNSVPSPQELSRLGHPDVLFLPVSATALTGAQRQEIITHLRPQVIVPMGDFSAMSRFASGYPSVYRLGGSAALLSREALPAVQTVLLFRAP